MTSRTLFISTFFLLALAGLIATAAGHHWWKAPVPGTLPTAAEEYGKLMSRYRHTDSAMDVAGTIRIYDGAEGPLKETRPFRCLRDRERYYCRLSYLQTFCDGRYVLQVDTVHRMLMVSKAIARGPMPVALLFSDTATFRMTGNVAAVGAQRELVLHNDYQPDVRECRVFYDTTDYRLRRAEIEWWKGANKAIWLGKVDYDYSVRRRFDIAAAMAVFVTIVDGRVTVNEAYKDYQLNTNL